jgi:hypothetical protein
MLAPELRPGDIVMDNLAAPRARRQKRQNGAGHAM